MQKIYNQNPGINPGRYLPSRRAVGFANKYHFGEKLAAIIEQATTGRITHDEDHEFNIKDFKEAISDLIWDEIY